MHLLKCELLSYRPRSQRLQYVHSNVNRNWVSPTNYDAVLPNHQKNALQYFVWILAKSATKLFPPKSVLANLSLNFHWKVVCPCPAWFQNMQPGLRLSIRLHHSACCSHHHCEGETALEPIRAGHSRDHAHRNELLCNFHPRVSA